MYIKRSKTPENNKYVYSGHPVHGHISLDRIAAMQKACKATANSNDYSATEEERELQLIEMLDKFVSQYPPHFSRELRPDLTSVVEDRIQWNFDKLVELSKDSYSFYLFKQELSRIVLKEYLKDSDIDVNLHMDKRELWLEDALNQWSNKIKQNGE